MPLQDKRVKNVISASADFAEAAACPSIGFAPTTREAICRSAALAPTAAAPASPRRWSFPGAEHYVNLRWHGIGEPQGAAVAIDDGDGQKRARVC
jgi:hypothetical protein